MNSATVRFGAVHIMEAAHNPKTGYARFFIELTGQDIAKLSPKTRDSYNGHNVSDVFDLRVDGKGRASATEYWPQHSRPRQLSLESIRKLIFTLKGRSNVWISPDTNAFKHFHGARERFYEVVKNL